MITNPIAFGIAVFFAIVTHNAEKARFRRERQGLFGSYGGRNYRGSFQHLFIRARLVTV